MKLADEVFLRTVHSKDLMGSDELEHCRAAHRASGEKILLLDISRRFGYLNEEQAGAIKRYADFVEAFREDEELGREVVRRKLLNERKVAAALRAQKMIFEAGKQPPRLLQFLEKNGEIDEKQNFSIRSSYEQQASSSGEFVVQKDSQGTTRRRRRDTRADARFEVPEALVDIQTSGIFWLPSPGRPHRKTELINLSVSGFQMITSSEVREGSRVRVSIHIPGLARPVSSKAVVRWVQNETEDRMVVYRAGLQFVDLLPEQKHQLKAVEKKVLQGGTGTRTGVAAAG